jgi:hypothetical protein
MIITQLQEYFLVTTRPLPSPSSSIAMDIILAALEKGGCYFPLFRGELTAVVGAYVLNNPNGVVNSTLLDIKRIIQSINQVTDSEGRDKYISDLEEELNSWKYCV